jgi:hypothetical protein
VQIEVKQSPLVLFLDGPREGDMWRIPLTQPLPVVIATDNRSHAVYQVYPVVVAGITAYVAVTVEFEGSISQAAAEVLLSDTAKTLVTDPEPVAS